MGILNKNREPLLFLLLAFCLSCFTACKKANTSGPVQSDTFFKIYNNMISLQDTGFGPYSDFIATSTATKFLITYCGGLTTDASGSIYLEYIYNGYFHLLKTDKSGHFLWNKNYSVISSVVSDGRYLYYRGILNGSTASSVFCKADTSGNELAQFPLSNVGGKIIYNPLSGDFLQISVTAYSGGGHVFVSMVDPLTGVVWNQNNFTDAVYLSANYSGYSYEYAGVVQTADKGFTTAWSFLGTTYPGIDSQFIALYHFNYQGQLTWQKQILTGYTPSYNSSLNFNSKFIEIPNGICLDRAGNYVIACSKQYAAIFSPSVAGSLELLKLDTNANLIDSAEIKIGYKLQLPSPTISIYAPPASSSFVIKDNGDFLLSAYTIPAPGLLQNNTYYMIDISQDLVTQRITEFASSATGTSIFGFIATGDGHTVACGTLTYTPDLFILKMNESEKY